MAGLDVPDKAERVRKYQHKTVHVALEIVGALGYESADSVSGNDVLRRTRNSGLRTFNEIYPWITVKEGALLSGSGPPSLQAVWEGKGAHDHLLWENA